MIEGHSRHQMPADPDRLYGLGFSRWKQRIVRQFFPNSQLVFLRKPTDVLPNSDVVVWGMDPVVKTLPPSVRILRLEDGFLRSVGLGADMVRPLSWVVDHQGIYYNANHPSDLESVLSTTIFDADCLARARSLREVLVSKGITKYNIGLLPWRRPPSAAKVVLVTGQVETDASLAYGAPGISRNMDLLRKARELHPSDYIVYKPHPDVVVRMRSQGLGEAEALRWCDEVVSDASMENMLEQCDMVHVMTSLSGFEALLRGKPVTCHGLPFYAGWGLTSDMIPIARRRRRLTLDELAAGCLIHYPRYLDRKGEGLVSVEAAVDELARWRCEMPKAVPWWWPLARVVLRRLRGPR